MRTQTTHFQMNTIGRRRLTMALLAVLCLGVCDRSRAEPTTRELLALRGVDDATWAQFVDGPPLGDEQIDPLCQVLLAERGLRLVDIQRWADRSWPVAASDVERGEIFQLAGRVQQVKRVLVPADLAAHGELPQYYECQIVLDRDDNPSDHQVAIVCAITVPDVWLEDDVLDEPVSAHAVFLKTTSRAPEGVVPIFAARRLAWHADTALGRLGMDVGLLDAVTDNEPLGGGDRECFYQMLSAVADDEAVVAANATTTPAVALFNDVEEIRGERVWLRGWTRRITRVAVDDVDVRARFGIDHYYQLEMFTDDSQHNPIVCCLRRLPDGIPTGDKIQENVLVTGFMMKKWAYRGEMASTERATDNRHVTRLAPLVIARTVTWHPDMSGQQDHTSGIVAGCVFAVVFFFIVTAVWRSGHRDRVAQRDR